MPELGSDNMFCLIKFHHYMYMVEFLHKHKSSKSPHKFEIYEAPQILSWFKQQQEGKELDNKIQEYFDLVKKGLLKIREQGSPLKVVECLNKAKARLEALPTESEDADEAR